MSTWLHISGCGGVCLCVDAWVHVWVWLTWNVLSTFPFSVLFGQGCRFSIRPPFVCVYVCVDKIWESYCLAYSPNFFSNMKWSKLFPMKAHRVSLRDQRRPCLCWSRSGKRFPRSAAEERRGWRVWGSLTSAKGKKVRLVGIPLQQSRHAASHSLVALVDEFLAEVVVYLLGRDAVVSRQGAVDELRQLENGKKKKEKSSRKSFKIHIRNKKTGKNTDLVKTRWMNSSTLNPPLGCWCIYLFSGSEKLWTGGGHGLELLGLHSGACLWATERPNVFTFLWAWGCKCLSNCCVIY